MGLRDVIIDQFSALSHKAALAQENRRGFLAPSWVPDSERRRLTAYTIRAAYLSNAARLVLPDEVSTADRSAHREYGDAGLLVDRLVAGTLGDEWTLTIDGSNVDGGELQLPARPAPAAPEADELESRLAAVQLARWEAETTALLDRWEAETAARPLAMKREAELREWADRAQLGPRLHEAERMATGLGDSVMVLWPQANAWPSVSVYEPGFYFPELDDDAVQDYPTTVHLAWEYEEARPDGRTEMRIRRQTWELTSITNERAALVAGTPEWIDEDGLVRSTARLMRGETVSEGFIRRRYPWQAASEPGSETTCVYSSGTWSLADVNAGKVDALDPAKADWDYHRVDLGIDFLPVVHVPNTASGQVHYGSSAIDLVAQVLDDVAQNDTDTMKASRFLGEPTIALSGATPPEDGVVAPGAIYGVGEKGRMDVLDLSSGLAALMSHGDRLLDRFWVNGRVPREMIGRVDASEAASGLALMLTFAPFAQVVGLSRMIRGPKYELIPRMAQRMAMLQGAIDAGPLPRARIAFGPYLPANRVEAVTTVSTALKAHAISTQTAVSLLVAAGFPIDEAAAEVERIFAEDTEAAKNVADATGSEALAATRLGLQLDEARPTAPVVELPG